MSQSDLLLRRCRNFIVNNAVFDSATEILAELDAHLAQPEAAEPSTAEAKLVADGVFKGEKGLRGLLDSESFWEQQPYGTRIYYGEGVADYLHRDILRVAVRLLDEKPLRAAPVAVRGRPEYGGKYGDLHKTMRLSHQGPVAAQPTDREQSEGICKEADGCPTEMAVLKRFWRAHHAAQSDVLANLDWERLRSGAYRALDPEHQDVFDMIAALRERGGK